MIKNAGIKIWVLTGDKKENAINIAFSCKLLTKDITRYEISEKRSVQIYKQIKHASNTQNFFLDQESPFALIVEDMSLAKIFKQEKLEESFIQLALRASVVLICRVSPLQKAEVVMKIKQACPLDVTLAIGDGANDVAMITEAHVGVGISGLEG
jgi:magnesium-transporting ATPase (P-type)